MRIKILGCHGGETPHHLTTSFLIEDTVCIDAGSICRSLMLEKQRQINHILISHSHMDHIKDLALLADQVIGSKTEAIQLHCGKKTAETLKESYFNNFLWPDFTSIPTTENPVMRIITHNELEDFNIDTKNKKLRVKYIPVNHPVESMAMIISDENAAFAYTSDTGPTKLFWKVLNQQTNLKALFCEISFPNSMQELADISGHFTPNSLQRELLKWDKYGQIPLYLYHLKPGFEQVTKDEIMALELKNMSLLTVGQEIKI